MRTIRYPDKAMLFSGILYSKEHYYDNAIDCLQDIFGSIAMESPITKWDFSDHYRDELGETIYRRFVFFKDLIKQEDLAGIKLATRKIEDKLSADGKRNVNLDPGYLTPAKIVLASIKDYSHRMYLKDGIFAEVTLSFVKGRFTPHINTYNDYKEEKYIRVFMMARELLSLLKN